MDLAPAIVPATVASPLTGAPPAREARELAAMLRGADLTAAALEATAAWLEAEKRQSGHTQAGYINDLSRWAAWCQLRGLNPLSARATEADLFAAAMRHAGLAPATRARRLASVSSWFSYLCRAEVAASNPFGRGMDRPKAPKVSGTRGVSEDQLDRMLAFAKERESARTYAVLTLMAATACRVSSVIGAQLAGLGEDRGHRVADLPVKGGGLKRFLLPAVTIDAIGTYRAQRGEDPGPLFVTTSGKPLDQPGHLPDGAAGRSRCGCPARHAVVAAQHPAHGSDDPLRPELSDPRDPGPRRAR